MSRNLKHCCYWIAKAALLFVLTGPSFAQGAGAIQFVSPTESDVFAPGDIIPVILAIEPGYTPSSVVLTSDTEIEPYIFGWSAAPYETVLNVPESFSGELVIKAVGKIAADPTMSENARITVYIRPRDLPVAIEVPASVDLGLPGSLIHTGEIAPIGQFANGESYLLNYPLPGLTYTVLDPSVATVDAGGQVTSVAGGKTFIRTELGSITEWTQVWVDDPAAGIPPPINHTADVTISASGFRLDADTGLYSQQVQITNNSIQPIHSPMALILESVPVDVGVENGYETKTVVPIGSPYVFVDPDDDSKGFLEPGQSVNVVVEFDNRLGKQISYIPKFYSAFLP